MRNLPLHVQQGCRPWHSSWSIPAPPEQSRLIRSLVISSLPAITTQQLSPAPLPGPGQNKPQEMVPELLCAQQSLGSSSAPHPHQYLNTSSSRGNLSCSSQSIFHHNHVSPHRRKPEEDSNQSVQQIFETQYFKVITLQCSLLPPGRYLYLLVKDLASGL